MLFVNYPARASEYTETCSQRAGSTRETSKKAKGGTAVASTGARPASAQGRSTDSGVKPSSVLPWLRRVLGPYHPVALPFLVSI